MSLPETMESPSGSPPSSKALPSQTSPSSEETSPVLHPKKSYSAVVQRKETLSKHKFEVNLVDGNPTAQIPDDIFVDSAPLWEDFLIGKFTSSTAPHVAKIHVIMNKIWTHGDKTMKIDVFTVNETTVKFRIREKANRERILRRDCF